MTAIRVNPDYSTIQQASFTAGSKGTIQTQESRIWKQNGFVHLTLYVYRYTHVANQEWNIANIPSGFRPTIPIRGALGCTGGSGYFVITEGGSVLVSGSITGGSLLINVSYPAA